MTKYRFIHTTTGDLYSVRSATYHEAKAKACEWFGVPDLLTGCEVENYETRSPEEIEAEVKRMIDGGELFSF